MTPSDAQAPLSNANAPNAAHSPALTRAAASAAARAGRTKLLLNGPIGPTLAKLAAPNVLAMLVQAAMSIAEGVFASRLGVTALAGLALVFPLVMLTQMLSAGSMGGAISSAVARALGAGNTARAGGLVWAAWIIAIVIAALSAILMALFGATIFGLLGGGGTVVDAAVTYASVFFPGCITLWLCHSTLSVIRGTGNMGTPSILLLLVSLATIPLSGALALGWGPFPALGMAGLAAGMVISYGVGTLVAVGYIVSGRAGLSLQAERLHSALFRDILSVGIIASINSFLTVLTIVLMVGMVGRHGAAALAGYGLGARLEFLMIPVVFGIGAAMTTMVGANIGAGNKERALRVAWTGSFAAAAIVGSIGAIVAFAPDLWLGIFLDPQDTEALAAGRWYFRLVAPFYGFFGLGLALYFASQGANRMGWPVIGSLVRISVAFSGALIMTNFTDWGVEGVFAAIGCGTVVYGTVMGVSVRITRWR
ncbi:MATE family efflux transporter [Roseobacter sp. N2S]|uniref:MATE family efflux transporter n=1 Tax=Roseobacter sp. N2S TaxID=2663844 RepID=UPI00286650CC|nr:MATE family efflux transporter [Roseobacter sp. N2S]MDR6264368.1 putative MATE family efflux protein [Roseobacter sp. N2S]